MDGFLEAFHENALAILDSQHHGVLQQVVDTYSTASSSTKETLVVTLSDAAVHLSSILKSMLGSENAVDATTLSKYKDATISIVALINSFILKAEKEEIESIGIAIGEGSKGKGKSSKKGWTWSNLKGDLISALIELFECPLARLWRRDYPDEEFVQLVTGIVYEMLENPANSRAVMSTFKEKIYTLFAILVSKYNHAVGASIKIMDLIQKFEHLGTVLAALLFRSVEYNRASGLRVLQEVIEEISRLDSHTFSTDSTAGKFIAVFVGECAEKMPKIMRSFIPLLLHHLGGEAYMLRNGIIHAIGHIIAKGFEKDEEKEEEVIGITRDVLLEVIEERFHDVTAFVRAKTCHIWSFLISQRNAVPLSVLPRVTELAIERLHDKTALTRRGAIQLLTNLLQYNPYGATLSLSMMEMKLDQIKSRLGENKDKEVEGDEVEALTSMLDDLLIEKENTEENTKKLQYLSNYYTSAISFANQLHVAVETVMDLLGSKNVTDVTESISFFIACKQFGIEVAAAGLRKMLLLVFSRDTAIVSAVMEAFISLYLTHTSEDKKLGALLIARGLVAIASGATLSELTSLENILQKTVVDKTLPAGTIDALWAIFTGKAPALLAVFQGVQIEDPKEAELVGKRFSLFLISLIAGADASFVRQKIDEIAEHGLTSNDYELIRISCLTLSTTNLSLSPTHPVLVRLSNILLESCDSDKDRDGHWFPMAEECLNTVYGLCSSPDVLLGGVLKSLAGPVLFNDMVSQFALSQVIFLAGHIAIRQLVFIEEKHALYLKNRTNKPINEKKEGLEAAFNAGTVDDADNEIIQEIQEKNIVCSNLLAIFGPIIIHICSALGSGVNDPYLATSASLSLCKFMTISKSFCESNLRLLFTLLENSTESSVRANIAVSLGDLAFRFPNLIEPYTAHIYAGLKDTNVRVKKNTLMVLTHLILNDMIKIKGQIAEMATCMVDEDHRISDLARLFFLELSNKGNAIYNLLPDITSHLSTGEGAVGQSEFREIMRYLLGFIKKERQSESLVEKFCNRFASTLDPVHWQNLAFCLSTLSINERSVRKLGDLFGTYSPALYDEDVYSCFKALISKSKKFSKTDSRQLVEDLEGRIDQAHEQGAEDHKATAQAMGDLQTARAVGRQIKAKAGDGEKKEKKDARKKKEAEEEEEEEDSEIELMDDEEEEEEEITPKGKKEEEEDSEIELMEEEEEEIVPKGKKKKKEKNMKKKKEAEEEEEEIVPRGRNTRSRRR